MCLRMVIGDDDDDGGIRFGGCELHFWRLNDNLEDSTKRI